MGDKDERGKALSVNVERGAGIFCKLSLFVFYPLDIDRTVYIIRWQAHHHHQLSFFSTPTPIKDSVGDDGVSAIRHF